MGRRKDSRIFVFGSNLAGRHGKGAALFAYKHRGAIYGQGEGLQGQSYAIPTKDHRLDVLALDQIETYITRFIAFATETPQLVFNVTLIGCGNAGYDPSDIVPFFINAPENVDLPPQFIVDIFNK